LTRNPSADKEYNNHETKNKPIPSTRQDRFVLVGRLAEELLDGLEPGALIAELGALIILEVILEPVHPGYATAASSSLAGASMALAAGL
jgi:hypothetical protein